jgi:hypothetical protein
MIVWLQCARCWLASKYEVESLTLDENPMMDCPKCQGEHPCIAVFIERREANTKEHPYLSGCINNYEPMRPRKKT